MNDSTVHEPALHVEKNFAPDRKRFQAQALPFTPTLYLNAEGTIIAMTPLARRMLEYRADEHVPPSFFSQIHGKNLYQVMCDLADMARGRKDRASWLVRMRTGRGRWRWYQATVRNALNTPRSAVMVTLAEI